MKRDLELIREIMLQIEAHEGSGFMSDADLKGAPKNEILFQLHLIQEDGYIESEIINTIDGNSEATIYGLTKEGRKYLDIIRDNSLWTKVIKTLKKIGGVILEVIRMFMPEIKNYFANLHLH